MKSLRVWLLTGTIALGSVAAFALPELKGPYPTCTTTPTEADRRAAQGAFLAGQGSFNEADYSTAIIYWRDAYRRDCTAHAMLINLARAWELKGDRGEAINALEIYLQRKPDAPDAEQIQRRIQNLKAQLVPPPTSASTPVADAGAPLASAMLPEAPAPTGKLNYVPLIVGGSGLTLATAGLLVWLGGASKVSDAEKACGTTHNQCPPNSPEIQKGNDGRSQQSLGGALLVVGGVATAGGLVWYYLYPRKPANSATASQATSQLHPVFAPGYAGVSLGGSF